MTAVTPVQFVDNRSAEARLVYSLGVLLYRLVADPFILMVVVGAAHSWWPQYHLPTISFVQALLIVIAGSCFMGPKDWLSKYEWKKPEE